MRKSERNQLPSLGGWTKSIVRFVTSELTFAARSIAMAKPLISCCQSAGIPLSREDFFKRANAINAFHSAAATLTRIEVAHMIP